MEDRTPFMFELFVFEIGSPDHVIGKQIMHSLDQFRSGLHVFAITSRNGLAARMHAEMFDQSHQIVPGVLLGTLLVRMTPRMGAPAEIGILNKPAPHGAETHTLVLGE